MGDAAVSYLTSQLTFQAPMLLVYFVGLILAAVFLGRAPTPAILTGVGVTLLGLTRANHYRGGHRSGVPR